MGAAAEGVVGLGLVVVWSKGGAEEDWVLELGAGEGEVGFREGGVVELGLVQLVGDGVAAGNVLVEGVQAEMGAGMRTGESFTG